jgi:hypothetical protein
MNCSVWWPLFGLPEIIKASSFVALWVVGGDEKEVSNLRVKYGHVRAPHKNKTVTVKQ